MLDAMWNAFKTCLLGTEEERVIDWMKQLTQSQLIPGQCGQNYFKVVKKLIRFVEREHGRFRTERLHLLARHWPMYILRYAEHRHLTGHRGLSLKHYRSGAAKEKWVKTDAGWLVFYPFPSYHHLRCDCLSDTVRGMKLHAGAWIAWTILSRRRRRQDHVFGLDLPSAIVNLISVEIADTFPDIRFCVVWNDFRMGHLEEANYFEWLGHAQRLMSLTLSVHHVAIELSPKLPRNKITHLDALYQLLIWLSFASDRDRYLISSQMLSVMFTSAPSFIDSLIWEAKHPYVSPTLQHPVPDIYDAMVHYTHACNASSLLSTLHIGWESAEAPATSISSLDMDDAQTCRSDR